MANKQERETTRQTAEVAPAHVPVTLCVQDTGPPDVESFAAHFLQRCLLSQAPPVLA